MNADCAWSTNQTGCQLGTEWRLPSQVPRQTDARDRGSTCHRYPPCVDPTVLAAIVGGLITGVPSVAAVAWSNWRSSKDAKADRESAREQAAEEARLARSASLALELGRLREELRSPEASVAWDALDDVRALMARVSSAYYTDDDRDAVWRLLQSRTAARAAEIQQYPQVQLPQVQVRPQTEGGS